MILSNTNEDRAGRLWREMRELDREKFLICLAEGIGREPNEWDKLEVDELSKIEDFDKLPEGLQADLCNSVIYKNRRNWFSIGSCIEARRGVRDAEKERQRGLFT